eukprot:XP_001698997.1 SWI/SNF2 superfamily protein [Chlamydomonas reinhardtii]
MVLLIREPNNTYDRWAIRVDNIRGDKIGHISREQAAVLSPLIDAGQLRIEGVVQGAKGQYNMPIDLLAFTPPEAADAVHSTAAMQPSMHPDPEVARENDSTSLPPFWEQVPGTAPRFRSTLTNFVGARRPAAVRGGILADDMGLGKTLTVISLIATNRPGLKELPPVTPLSLADPDPDEPPTHTAAAGAGAGPSASAVPAEAAAGKSKARGGKAAAAEKGKDLQEHTAGNLKVYQYHGPERSSSPAVLCAQDVAHLVKNPRAKASRAAAQLQAERRWAVTGTPIQNRMQDLHGLLVFLRVDPLQDRSLFTRTIERPLKQGDPRAVKTVQVGPAGRPLVALPSKTVRLVTVDLTPEDRAKYDALELEARRIISHALATDELLDHYISVLEIILRLRQVADAGCLPRTAAPSAWTISPRTHASLAANTCTANRMLNLVGRALEAEGISYVRLDGSTPAKARAERLRRFASREPGSPLVFLSSLKAGGVGMNLTAASAVHLMDPWWNPAVEEQAMDRVHRLGQTRDVENGPVVT